MSGAGGGGIPGERLDFDAMPTLGDIARYHARRSPDAIATTFEYRDTTWSALDTASDLVAAALIAGGCKAGERIAYVGKGTDEFFALMFGAAKAGVVLVPIQWRLTPEEIGQIARDAEATFIFVGSDQFCRLDDLRSVIPQPANVITMESGASSLPIFQDWCAGAPRDFQAPAVDPGAVAWQMYTSGTTGQAKGVMLSHRNILGGRRESMRVRMDWNDWVDSDVSLVALPVGHVGGIAWAIVGLFNGARCIIQREFIPRQVLDAIEHQRVSRLFVVPTALHMLLLEPRVRQIDYRNLRHILYGASPIALDLLREATLVFGCGFCQQYGMTETCGTIVYLPPEDHDPAGSQRMRAAGIPMPGVELRVVDAETREPLPAGTVGEVETRSLANMIGYWNNLDETAQTISGDGWLRTGDAGYLDVDGYLYIQDRIKDMIVSGAENIYPAQVENAIYGHPAVQEVAVIGVPDEKWGEAVKAIVVPKSGFPSDPQDIIAFARTRIAAFKVPKTVDFVPALPRGPSGKILRRKLRDLYWKGRERQVN